ncbi:glycosyltransferase family 2 protein [Halomonas qinghailakensis]|uniref:Glycosyltransferase family 2 protein n=1 Tax=Halomonas qinghailakensis TaxID=2937790 RepID=A0AA46TSM8_9GAMM|nr:glycosyltransferase family A protein [Halomonas sp. ZZQ-149]UYO75790.1 glycosyltransferase family 2 protein [Halomonas sp. ZZQ-149]
MSTVCFILDALVTSALLPRHLRAIRQTGLADHLLPIIVTSSTNDPRISCIEQRYRVHFLISPSQSLGARINQAASLSQADWLLIAMHQQALEANLWCLLYPQLDTCLLDAVLIDYQPPSISERLLQRFLGAGIATPPYLAIRRAWLERLGGLDPELEEPALADLLQRLYACPTRLQTFSLEASRLDHDPSLMAANPYRLPPTSPTDT